MSTTTPSTTDVINPATEEVITTLELADVAQTDRAIETAQRAFQGWREVSPADRARLLRRFAAVVDEHVEELAQLEVANAGHTIGNARWEAGNVRDVLNYYAGAPERPGGETIPVDGGVAGDAPGPSPPPSRCSRSAASAPSLPGAGELSMMAHPPHARPCPPRELPGRDAPPPDLVEGRGPC